MSLSILKTEHLSKYVQEGEHRRLLFQDVQIDIQPRDRIVITGPSGCGKSSLLNILGTLDPDFEGEVHIQNTPIKSMSDVQRSRFRNQTLGFVFQSFHLVQHLTLLQNVALPAFFSSQVQNIEHARALLERVGIQPPFERRPSYLSGGEKQRVAIARALYHKPALLLADEPTGNLDGETGRSILKLFEDICEEGTAIMMITHDPEIQQTFATRAYRIQNHTLQAAN